MGSAKIDLTQLELGKAEDINLQLSDTNNGEPGLSMGEIIINLTLWPRSQEDKEMVSVYRGEMRGVGSGWWHATINSAVNLLSADKLKSHAPDKTGSQMSDTFTMYLTDTPDRQTLRYFRLCDLSLSLNDCLASDIANYLLFLYSIVYYFD